MRLTNRVSRIVGDIDVYEAEKKEITRELTSHFYDHAMMHAQERGSTTIERQDIEAVFAESEDPREIAAGYMASYVSGLRRAGFWPRFFAYLIDMIIFGLIIGAVVAMFTIPFIVLFPNQFNLIFLTKGHFQIFANPNGPVAILISFLVGTTHLDRAHHVLHRDRGPVRRHAGQVSPGPAGADARTARRSASWSPSSATSPRWWATPSSS